MPVSANPWGNLLAQRPQSPESFTADRQAVEAGGITNALNAAKLGEYQQGLQRSEQLRNLLSSGAGSDQLVNGGFLKEGMDLAKNKADVANTNAQESTHRVDAFAKKASLMKSSIGSVPSPQAAARYMQQAFADPDMGPVMKQFGTLEEALSEIPQDPAGFQKWQMQASEGIGKLATHALQQQQFGETVRHNKSTEGTAAGQLSVARQRLTLDQQAPKGQYDAERGLLVDPRTGEARPVTMGGQQLGAKDKPLNDSQSKALLFGSRMQEANKILAELEGKGVDKPGAIKRTVEGTLGLVPFAGDSLANAGGSLTNWTQSGGQQQVEQAQRDFVNAVLRRESGAAISPGEFDSAKRQYFPQIGDSESVKAQKARNRELATRGMLAEVPQEKRNSISGNPEQPKPGSTLHFDANGNRVK